MHTKCVFCNGKGYIVLKRSKMVCDCSVCSGKGNIDVPEGKELCPKCKGSRNTVVMLSTAVFFKASCEQCSGTGFVERK